VEFSPNPQRPSFNRKGVRPGRIEQFLVLSFLYGENAWIDSIYLWDLAVNVNDDHIWETPNLPREQIKTRTYRREIFSISLRWLLLHFRVGDVPTSEVRQQLHTVLTQYYGLPSTFLYRSWEGMFTTYQRYLNSLKPRVLRPGKLPRANRKRGHSDGSSAKPERRHWRPPSKTELPSKPLPERWYLYYRYYHQLTNLMTEWEQNPVSLGFPAMKLVRDSVASSSYQYGKVHHEGPDPNATREPPIK
jgi:hypothetical protein